MDGSQVRPAEGRESCRRPHRPETRKRRCLQMTLVHPILLNSHARETRQGFIVFARCWSICATPFKRRLLAGRRKIKPPST